MLAAALPATALLADTSVVTDSCDVDVALSHRRVLTVCPVLKRLLTGLCQPESGAEEVTVGGGGWRGCAGKRSSSTASGTDHMHMHIKLN